MSIIKATAALEYRLKTIKSHKEKNVLQLYRVRSKIIPSLIFRFTVIYMIQFHNPEW